MSLRDVDLKYKYRSDKDSLVEGFYNRCLIESIKYDRAVGYFTSHSLSLIASGLYDFLERDGKIRLICNPYLVDKDIEAIRKGYKSKSDVILESMLREIKITEQSIEKDTLNVLSWLIYTGKLDMKIAYTKNDSIYHEKFGIFYDREGNKVAFSGSSNETAGGLINNFEKIDVYFREGEQDRINDSINDFKLLWENETNGLIVRDLPEKIRSYILSKRSENKPSKAKKENIEVRKYQQEAVREFRENNWVGILNMATGTGKTITSLLCAREYYEFMSRIFVVVLVPLNHLVDQWIENMQLFGYEPVLKCYDSKKNWLAKLEKKVRNYNIGITKKEFVIAVYKTASSGEFQSSINKIVDGALLIADECHNFGTNSFINHRLWNIRARIGLSATPDRWWDDEGTERIVEYFDRTIYEYPLEKAIEKGALVPYKYEPIIVGLTEDEIERYTYYTACIIKWYNSSKIEAEDEIQKYNRKRSLVISKAYEKKEVLYKMLRKCKHSELCHILVYCAPSEIDDITRRISDIGIRVHKFDSRVKPKDRQNILEAFDKKQIQVLVAIKCLDEGVDIPNTRTAYFLASTSNPREFVQRRGRVLRKAAGKDIAKIYDFIVLPDVKDEVLFKSIASKEMPRFAEFSLHAINQFKSRSIVRPILEELELEYLMDKLPWEIYHEMNEKYGR